MQKMEFKFSLEVETPREKIAAIRTVVSMGKIGYDARLKLIADILGYKPAPVSSVATPAMPISPPAKSGESPLTHSLPTDHPNLKKCLDVPMRLKEDILNALVLKWDGKRADGGWSQFGYLANRLGWKHGWVATTYAYETYYKTIHHHDGIKFPPQVIVGALFLGMERGLICMTITKRISGYKFTFYTSGYARKYPELEFVAGIPSAIRGDRCVAIQTFSNYDESIHFAILD